MKRLVCEMCGSPELVKQDGMYICQSCGTKYSTEEAKKMMVEVDNSTKIENLYILARRAKESNNAEDALKFYDQIRAEVPNDWEANFFAVYYKALNCKIIDSSIEAQNVANCIPQVFSLIKGNVESEEERVKAVKQVLSYGDSIGDILYAAERKRYENSTGVLHGYKILSQLVKELVDKFSGEKNVFLVGVPYVKKWLDRQRDAVHSAGPTELEQKCVQLIQVHEPEYQWKLKESSGGCYVATAVYGSYDCPQVWTLRRYRDCTLARTWYGRAFIHAYYAISPTLVKWFGNTIWFKRLWRGKLDTMVENLKSRGFDDSPYEDKTW